MRRLLGYPTWALLVLLVGLSAALRAWAAGTVPTPWIVPDEPTYGELGRALWQTGHLTLYGESTRFFSFVYPALAGLPLSRGDLQAGYALLQGFQAVVMSLAAVPAYLWVRRLATREWALVAAALALVPPGLAYSGLIMTEVAFYPAFVVAAWAVWKAVVEPSPRAQALALGAVLLLCAVRLQGFVVALAWLTAIGVEHRRWRAHVPAVAGLAALAVVWAAWQLRHGGPVTQVLGGYQAAGETHYGVGRAVRFLLYELGDIVLISGVVPVLALVLLARTRDAQVRTFVVLTFALSGWLALQVGIFASRHVGNPAERNLFALVPVLAIGLVVWLQRGAPRPRAATAIAGALCVALLVLFPVEKFASLAAAPSNFTLVPLYRLTVHVNLELVVPLAAAALVVLAFLRPRIAVVALFVLGAAASIATSRFVAREAKAVQQLTLGADRQWIQAAADGPVAFVYTASVSWEAVWEGAFWNPRVRTFYDLGRAEVPGALPQRSVGPLEDGRLVFADQTPAPARYALASTNTVAFAGTERQAARGLTLWRVEQPLRLTRWIRGLDTSSFGERGTVELDAFACTGGTLHGLLESARLRTVRIRRNGVLFDTVVLQPNVGVNITVPAKVPQPAGRHLCRFTLAGDGPFFARSLLVY